MSIKRINEFPEGGDSLSPDDIFLFMDDPSGDKVTKKISLSELASIIGGGGAISGTTFQISTVDLHNGGVQNAQVLKFDNASYQSVITGPTPASGNNSQRIIIQGQKAQGNGEGGDVYLWGGDASVNGGDIKIYAGDADSNETGTGGYVNIDGGKGATNGGNIEITAGYSEGGQAGNVSIVGGPTSAGVAGNVVIKTNNSTKNWTFDKDGKLTFPGGGILSETNNTVSIAPPTAASGQSLVIRPTAATWSVTSSGYIVYGSPITISVNLLSWSYFGTVNYLISGSGVTQESLGRPLTGNIVFTGISSPDTKDITWTIPANSNITEFTLTLTSVNGTRSTNYLEENDPALYYNFEYNAMPTDQFVTVTNNGMSNSEHSHVHLVAGDPSTVDIYLGDDDQYVKIEKNDGDVVIGTNSNTYHWTFGDDGKLMLPGGSAQIVVENDYGVRIGTAGTNTAPNNQIKIGGAEHALEIFGGPPGYSWKFDTNGELTLPVSGSITFPNGTTQTSAGIPSNTGLVPNSTSITNIVKISQANYDSLPSYDPNTIYYVT